MNSKLVCISVAAIFVTACSSAPVAVKPQTQAPKAPVAAQKISPAPAVAAPEVLDAFHDPKNPLSRHVVYFDYDTDQVNPGYMDVIRAHGDYVAMNPSVNVTLTGGADDRGSHEYNLALGQKRAAAVRNIMALLNVPDSRLETVSVGKEMPVCEGEDEGCRSLNRRVEIGYGKIE